MQKKLLALAISSMFIGVTGCGGSSSSSSPEPTETSGKAIDGYLSGMNCFADINGDGTYNADSEPQDTTNTTGDYTLTLEGDDVTAYPIICESTDNSVDEGTGNPFVGVVSAPAGYKNITPLSTLAKELGEEQAREFLGLGADEDLGEDFIATQNNEKYQAAFKVQRLFTNIAGMLGDGSVEGMKSALRNLSATLEEASANGQQYHIDSAGTSDLLDRVADKSGVNVSDVIIDGAKTQFMQGLSGLPNVENDQSGDDNTGDDNNTPEPDTNDIPNSAFENMHDVELSNYELTITFNDYDPSNASLTEFTVNDNDANITERNSSTNSVTLIMSGLEPGQTYTVNYDGDAVATFTTAADATGTGTGTGTGVGNVVGAGI